MVEKPSPFLFPFFHHHHKFIAIFFKKTKHHKVVIYLRVKFGFSGTILDSGRFDRLGLFTHQFSMSVDLPLLTMNFFNPPTLRLPFINNFICGWTAPQKEKAKG